MLTITKLSGPILALVILSSFPQTTQTNREKSDPDVHTKHSIAVNLLRAIGTAEYDYKTNHGTFADRDALLASEELKGRGMEFAASNEPQLVGAKLAAPPEILPGWSLRLNLIDGGSGYDVELQDTTDKACGYAALSDERAIIRQSKTIDCDI